MQTEPTLSSHTVASHRPHTSISSIPHGQHAQVKTEEFDSDAEGELEDPIDDLDITNESQRKNKIAQHAETHDAVIKAECGE